MKLNSDLSYTSIRGLVRNNKLPLRGRTERGTGFLMVLNFSLPYTDYKNMKLTQVSKTFKLDSRSVDGKGHLGKT